MLVGDTHYVAGQGPNPGVSSAAVERFTSTGIDTSFGDDGSVFLDAEPGPGGPFPIAVIEPDGNILAADADLYRLLAK